MCVLLLLIILAGNTFNATDFLFITVVYLCFSSLFLRSVDFTKQKKHGKSVNNNIFVVLKRNIYNRDRYTLNSNNNLQQTLEKQPQ